MTDIKTLDTLSKILNQADRAEEGSPEREAFMEKALKMSAATQIGLDIARAHVAKKERIEEPEEREVKVAERSNTRLKFFTELYCAIADAYGVKYLLSKSGQWVFPTGFPSDLDMVERLYIVLSVQMVQEADAALKRGDHKEIRRVLVTERVEIPEADRNWSGWDRKRQRWYASHEDWLNYQEWLDEDGKPASERSYWHSEEFTVYSYEANRDIKPYWPPSHKDEPVLDAEGNRLYVDKVVSSVDGRIWRANFYKGFISRIGRRLREARRAALKEAGIDVTDESGDYALAIRDKEQEVEEAHVRQVLATEARLGKPLSAYQGAELTRSHYEGQVAGVQVADKARLGDEKEID